MTHYRWIDHPGRAGTGAATLLQEGNMPSPTGLLPLILRAGLHLPSASVFSHIARLLEVVIEFPWSFRSFVAL
jgi:hypothetical protein